MKINTLLAAGSIAVLFAGCWTVSETEYPDVEVARLPAGKATSVSFSGFEVELQKFVPVEGHEQMKTNAADRVDGPCVKENNSTNQFYMTRNTVSRKLIDRASVGMERKGFEIKTRNPQYVVDMKYTGPFDRDYDALKWLGLSLCTILTADKNVQTWTGDLKVYDRATKKAIFEKSYTNEYSVAVWGPIPIASPACHPQITCTACSSAALSMLTDEAIADASKAIVDRVK